MTDPTRLMDGGATDAELAILTAGAAEEPPAHGRQKLAALLGLSAGLSASTAAVGTKAAAASALQSAVSGLGAKWLLLATAGAVAGGGYWVMRERTADVVVPREAKVEATPNAAVPATADHQTDDAPPPSGTDAPLPKPIVQGNQRGLAPELTPHGARSIGVEIEKLDGVRRSLRSNSPADALRQLDGYYRDHPSGVLSQEAALLRIEALAASGNTAGARSAAERFLRDNPKTPHRRRISALVGDVP